MNFSFSLLSYCTLEREMNLVRYQENVDVLCAAIFSNIHINLLGYEGKNNDCHINIKV